MKSIHKVVSILSVAGCFLATTAYAESWGIGGKSSGPAGKAMAPAKASVPSREHDGVLNPNEILGSSGSYEYTKVSSNRIKVQSQEGTDKERTYTFQSKDNLSTVVLEGSATLDAKSQQLIILEPGLAPTCRSLVAELSIVPCAMQVDVIESIPGADGPSRDSVMPDTGSPLRDPVPH